MSQPSQPHRPASNTLRRLRRSSGAGGGGSLHSSCTASTSLNGICEVLNNPRLLGSEHCALLCVRI